MSKDGEQVCKVRSCVIGIPNVRFAKRLDLPETGVVQHSVLYAYGSEIYLNSSPTLPPSLSLNNRLKTSESKRFTFPRLLENVSLYVYELRWFDM